MARIEELKAENIQLVRRCLYERHGVWTRPELSAKTGISMAGTENVLKALQDKGEVIYTGDAPSTGGRKSKQYGLRPDYAHIGMMLLSHRDGKYAIASSSVNLEGGVICKERILLDSADLQDLLEAVDRLSGKDPLLGCLVLSVPSIVDPHGMLLSGDFPKLQGKRLGLVLEDAVPFPVRIENDMNLAVVGYAALHPDCSNLAVLYQPDNDPAGAGIIMDGRLVKGLGGFAGEIGRIEKKKQLQLLREDPQYLVRLQLAILACTFAPERIAWYSPAVQGAITLDDSDIPEASRPVLERMEGLELLAETGADEAGRQILIEAFKP